MENNDCSGIVSKEDNETKVVVLNVIYKRNPNDLKINI